MKYPFDCISDFIFVVDDIEPSDIILIPGGSHPQLMEKAVELYIKGLEQTSRLVSFKALFDPTKSD